MLGMIISHMVVSIIFPDCANKVKCDMKLSLRLLRGLPFIARSLLKKVAAGGLPMNERI